MADYRKFLGATQSWVAPWLGGPTIADDTHRLELAQPPPRPGWYRVTARGKKAAALEPADALDLSALPAVRGVWLDGALVTADARMLPLHLPPDDEPARFSPVTSRRWHSGELLFDTADFESEAHDAARQALAQQAPLTAPGVGAEVRAAFSLATARVVAQRLEIPASAGELRHHLRSIADGGPAAAETALRALDAERTQARREWEELQRRRAAAALKAQVDTAREVMRENERLRGADARIRATAAMERAGAVVESARLRDNGAQVEVVYTFMHERLIALADALTLQVLDSGICLGHPPRDEDLTLDSLPSVVKEAIDTDALVILRWP